MFKSKQPYLLHEIETIRQYFQNNYLKSTSCKSVVTVNEK